MHLSILIVNSGLKFKNKKSFFWVLDRTVNCKGFDIKINGFSYHNINDQLLEYIYRRILYYQFDVLHHKFASIYIFCNL